jgi:hypothetical protein
MKFWGMGFLAAIVLALPIQAQAQLANCQVGQRVAMPAGYGGKWLNAVVIEVNQNNAPFVCRVHPLGYTPYADANHMPKQLRDPGSVQLQPIGGIVDDPYLLAARGKKAYKATRVVPGHYECAAFTGGRLEVRPSLEFVVLDGSRYQDAFGAKGTYAFDAASGGMTFHGAALDGQHGTYKQASDPPVKTQPPEFNFDISHDSCTLAMR